MKFREHRLIYLQAFQCCWSYISRLFNGPKVPLSYTLKIMDPGDELEEGWHKMLRRNVN